MGNPSKFRLTHATYPFRLRDPGRAGETGRWRG